MNRQYDISLEGLAQNLIDEKGRLPTAVELDKTEAALLAFAELHAVTPPLSMRDRILGNLYKLAELQKKRQYFTLDNLPLLTADVNWLDWEEAVKCIEPPEEFEDVYVHLLEDNEQRELSIVWVKDQIPEEVHYDVLESFILLEGTCECHIYEPNGGKRIVKMRAGDYLEFKIGELHDFIVTSLKPAKAILQTLKLAA